MKLKKSTTTAAIAGVAVALLAVAAPAMAGKTPAKVVPVHTYTTVGTDPFAAAQPTARGKQIFDLGMDGAKLYVGYGDYDANTGPQQVHTFDTTTKAFSDSLLQVPSEEINTMRKIGGAMYAPMIDPRDPWTAPVGYATNATGTWTNQMQAPAIHVFDVASRDGQDLWFVGSAGTQDSDVKATAYRSTDGGTTWSVAATDTSLAPQGWERYYWAAAINGKMYLQAENVTEGAPLRVFDGTTWTTQAGKPCSTYEAHRVETFNNKILCEGSGASLSVFDGTTTRDAGIGQLWDLAVPGDGYAYALTMYTNLAAYEQTMSVWRTADGITWTPLTTAPSDAMSVAVGADGGIYVGTRNSAIVKVNDVSTLPTPTPSTTTSTKGGKGNTTTIATSSTTTSTPAPVSTTTSSNSGKGSKK